MADPDRAAMTDETAARGAWVDVALSAIRGNLDYARALIPQPVKFMAVVKADAYGHGMLEVARTALAWGCEWLGVGNLAEGLALREAGIAAPCLVLAPPLPGDEPSYVNADLVPSIDSQAGAAGMAAAVRSAAAGGAANPRPVHLLIDTGLGRYGVAPAAAASLAGEIAAMPELALSGIYTHFARPADRAAGLGELSVFKGAVAAAEAVAGTIPLHHAAGSEAAVLIPEARLDLVRLGNLLYGYWAGDRAQLPKAAQGVGLRPALTIRCRVAAVRDVARGQSLGYGGYRAPRAMRIAVLPIGFSDGVGLRTIQAGAGAFAVFATMAREAVKATLPAHRPAVLINGKTAPIVGRVGMQFTLADVTGIPDVAAGTLAEVPGVRATAAAGLPRRYLP